jgi:3-(3-hydroxy-phenyl)propionate hydroxylase
MARARSGIDITGDAEPPVLVAGAGPVGQTTAALLARWGVQVRLFDQREARDPVGSKSICQARDVLDIWEMAGVGRRLAREGTTWTTARTFFQDREIASWRFTDRGRSAFPPCVNIGQQRTEQLLDEALGRLCVPTSWGHDLVAVEQTGEQVTARFRCRDGETEVAGSYLVAATGSRSNAVRDQLGVTFAGETFDDQFLICDIKADLAGWETERRFYFDPEWNPGRQVLIHACPDSTYRIDWQVPGEYDLAEDEAAGGLDDRIRRILGDRDYSILWKSVYRFHSRHADRMQIGRTFLAGDVAHLLAPFGARGLNTGVFDAENAAWKIAFALQGRAGPGLLASYNSERLAATMENIEVTSATVQFLAPQTDEARRERRRLLLAAAADPVVAANVDSGRFAEPFWYVNSPLTTPDPARPFAGRPPKGMTPAPAPGILVPDSPVTVPGRPAITRLRELLRAGFAILLPDASALAAVQSTVERTSAGAAEIIVLNRLGGGPDVIRTLGMRAGEAWIIRPDAYVAAVARAADAGSVAGGLRRALGY